MVFLIFIYSKIYTENKMIFTKVKMIITNHLGTVFCYNPSGIIDSYLEMEGNLEVD